MFFTRHISDIVIIKIKIVVVVGKKMVPFVEKSLRQERISNSYCLMCESYHFSDFESCI